MMKVQLSYNPYTVKTEIWLNGRPIEKAVSPLRYVANKRLQEWTEPKGSWKGFFKELRMSSGENQIEVEFIGTSGDFEDLVYAKEKFGDCFDKIELIHKNKATAKDADPYEKMKQLRELYKELQDGPVEEFKTPDIQRNFEEAVNSDFRIVIVAPMSSGKSTLINAIVGRDLLPAVNQATTAVITEIKDNDAFTEFLVNADDKYGSNVAKDEIATKELISELNYKKDPQDPEGKDALIHLIRLEGPIPNLPSDTLKTVFVDTPGGNNSQNDEHEDMMDEAISDENKSLILYVFNGAQLGTNDSNIILQKIANAMKNSTNGKQSRDRFLFVANRMDEFDPTEEPYEDVIKNTILPQLASNGIIEPKLFLASAQTAKLIRMVLNHEKLSRKEEVGFESYVKWFNMPNTMLSQYASLNSADKEKLTADAEKYVAAGKEAGREIEDNKCKAAEINSGIPAIEMAIREYLQKYAIAIKIKTVHDTFMKKVVERNMINECEKEWADSREKFDAVKNELQEKREKCDHSKKLQEFREKVAAIQLDEKLIKEKRSEVIEKISKQVNDTPEEVDIEEVEYRFMKIRHEMEKIGKEAQTVLENALNNEVLHSCQNIVEEYKAYIKELDAAGAFTIGSFDIKKTESFAAFDLDRAEEMLRDEKYLTDEKYLKVKKIKTGEKKVKKKGFFQVIARIFGGGYEYRDIIKEKKSIAFRQFIWTQVMPAQHAFDQDVKDAIAVTKGKVETLKGETVKRLEGLDKMVADLMAEMDKLLASQKELAAKVASNQEKAQWIKEFIGRVDDLLTI